MNKYNHIFLFFLFNAGSIISSPIAYIPDAVKNVFAWMANADSSKKNIHEVRAMLEQGRVLASSQLMRKAIEECFEVLQNSSYTAEITRSGLRSAYNNCLKAYLNNLNEHAIVLHTEGKKEQLKAFSPSLVAAAIDRQLDNDAVVLSNMLTPERNLDLCAFKELDDQHATSAMRNMDIDKSIKETSLADPSFPFTANMLTSTAGFMPNIIFGTGVAMPTINAWVMAPSSSIQTPINMQFGIPGDLRTQKAMSIDMHFLVSKQDFASGNVRIRVNALYVQNYNEFNMPETVQWTYTTDSDDFEIIEPTSSDKLVHVYVNVPIEKQNIYNYDFALLSLSRVAPDGGEYAGDIYLATSIFRYTPKAQK